MEIAPSFLLQADEFVTIGVMAKEQSQLAWLKIVNSCTDSLV